MKLTKLSPVKLVAKKAVNEAAILELISSEPVILGLGDVEVKDKQRIQSGGGRLDLLLQDVDEHGRYEVEIQLGQTDPSHIIRTIEYWDAERKRYPQYDHTAVIIAEDITSRFLNVISLFNGAIPIIAIQMNAVEIEGGIGLFFTKILDTVAYGYVAEDEEVNEPATRADWEARATPQTVKMADQILELCADFSGKVELRYNKHYIGLRDAGAIGNFAECRPRKIAMALSIKLQKSADLDTELDKHELDLLDYDQRSKRYRIRLTPAQLAKHGDYLKTLLKAAFDLRNAE